MLSPTLEDEINIRSSSDTDCRMLVPDQDVIVKNRRYAKLGRSRNSTDDNEAKGHSWVAKYSKPAVNPFVLSSGSFIVCSYHTLSALCDISDADYRGTCLN